MTNSPIRPRASWPSWLPKRAPKDRDPWTKEVFATNPESQMLLSDTYFSGGKPDSLGGGKHGSENGLSEIRGGNLSPEVESALDKYEAVGSSVDVNDYLDHLNLDHPTVLFVPSNAAKVSPKALPCPPGYHNAVRATPGGGLACYCERDS